MTIDIDQFRHAIFLATGDEQTKLEAERIGKILSVPEEILPYLLLRRVGFGFSPEMRKAMETAIAKSPGPPSTRRVPDLNDTLAITAVRTTVKAATKALIERDLAEHDAHARLDQALADLVSRGPLQEAIALPPKRG